MKKRGLLLKTIELIFTAVLFLAFLGILTKLILPGIIGETRPALEDFERYTAEMNTLERGDTVPVTTINANYTLALYAPSAQKPTTCKRGACLCIYRDEDTANALTPLKCTPLDNIHDTCTPDTACLSQPIITLNKIPSERPETIYFCQDTNGRITVTKTEDSC